MVGSHVIAQVIAADDDTSYGHTTNFDEPQSTLDRGHDVAHGQRAARVVPERNDWHSDSRLLRYPWVGSVRDDMNVASHQRARHFLVFSTDTAISFTVAGNTGY